jgi:hypothetical protein
MDKRTLIDLVKNSCNFLEQDGYKFNHVESMIFYTKSIENERYKIGFSWNEYGEEYEFYGVSVFKCFDIVEMPISQAFGNDSFNIYVDYTIGKVANAEFIPSQLKYSLWRNAVTIPIKSEADLFLFIEFLESFYLKVAKLFLEQFKSLLDVASWLDNHTMNEHRNLLTSLNDAMIFRKLFILKYVNNPEFSDLLESYYAYLKEKAEKDSENIFLKRDYEAFKKFKNYLLTE